MGDLSFNRYYEAICSLPKLEAGSFDQYLQDSAQACLTCKEKAKDEVCVCHIEWGMFSWGKWSKMTDVIVNL